MYESNETVAVACAVLQLTAAERTRRHREKQCRTAEGLEHKRMLDRISKRKQNEQHRHNKLLIQELQVRQTAHP